MDPSPFDLPHGPQVLLLDGDVGQPGIMAGDLDALMPEKLLEAFKAHPGIEKLTGKGVSETVKRMALMDEPSLFEILVEQMAGRRIAEGRSCPCIEETLLVGITLL